MKTLIGAAEPDGPRPFGRVVVTSMPYGANLTWVNTWGSPSVVGYSSSARTGSVLSWTMTYPPAPFGP